MSESAALREQLHGVNSHVPTLQALEGLDPQLAGRAIRGMEHTIFQMVHHMVYWQDITLARIRQQEPERPGAADLGWQAAPSPEDSSDWEAAIAQLAEGLREVETLLADADLDLGRPADSRRGTTARQEILTIMAHNSYHLGQVVVARQFLGAWPPPRGGDTW